MSKYSCCFITVLSSFVALGAFLLGYQSAVIAPANLFVHYGIRPYTAQNKQLVTSILTLGAAVGALFGGFLSDKFGRKPVILASDALFVTGAALLATAGSVDILVLGRIVSGLGVGMAGTVVPVYLSEVSPTPLRGRIITMYQLLLVTGGFSSYLICYLLQHNWRTMFGISMVPAFIQGVGMLFMPESPRWLMKYQRETQAMKSFSKIYNLQESLAEKELRAEISEIKSKLRAEGNLSYFQQLKGLITKYYKGVIIGQMLFVIQQFSGVNTISYYAPSIVRDAGFGAKYSGLERERRVLLFSLPIYAIQMTFTIVVFFLIDRRGRRYLMLCSLPLMAFFMFLLAFAFYFINIRNQAWARWLALGSMGFYMVFYALGMGATVYAVNAQIYPLPLRATANSIAITAHWISNYGVTAAFLSVIASPIGGVLAYSFLGLCSLLGLLFIYKYLPETKGLPLPQIVKLFQSGDSEREKVEQTLALIPECPEDEELK